jgi:hypothetical protein
VLPADAEVDAVRTCVEKLVIAARAGAWKRLRMKSEGTAAVPEDIASGPLVRI